MGKTPAENIPYTPPRGRADKTGGHASYTPTSSINEHSYGKDGGKPNAVGTVPTVDSGTSTEAPLPKAFTGDFGIGDDKNVSTPVTG